MQSTSQPCRLGWVQQPARVGRPAAGRRAVRVLARSRVEPQGEAVSQSTPPQAVSKRSVLAIGAALSVLAGSGAGPALAAEPAITQKVRRTPSLLG